MTDISLHFMFRINEFVFVEAAGVPQTINLFVYALLLCQRLNGCIFMTCDKMIERGVFFFFLLQKFHSGVSARSHRRRFSPRVCRPCLNLTSVHLVLSSYQPIYI